MRAVTLRTLALKILAAERGGGGEAERRGRLVASLTAEERQTLPGRWIATHGELLEWEDNLLALAERVLGLPTKPLDPHGPAMREYERQVDAALAGGGAPPAP